MWHTIGIDFLEGLYEKKVKNGPFLRDIIYEQGLGDIHKLGNALGSRGQKTVTKISKI
jgi:hypothetical protein